MKKNLIRILSLCLVFLLVTAAALTFTSCNEKVSDDPSESVSDSSSESTSESPSESEAETGTPFKLEITFADGKTETLECKSDAKSLGEYLVQKKLVEGTTSEYGLMITSVKGEKHDFNEDGSYWAFYIDGEYASTGVDSTPIEEGKTYALKATLSE